MDFSSFRPVEAAVTLSVIWIGLGGAGLALARSPRVVTAEHHSEQNRKAGFIYLVHEPTTVPTFN